MIFAVMQTDKANESLGIANMRGTSEANARATTEAEANVRATAVVNAEISEAHALEQAAVAQSRSLAASSLTLGHENNMRALLLAIAAGDQVTTTLAFTALNTQLSFMPAPLQTLSHEDVVIGAAWNGDESRILTWSSDDTVVLWEAASGERLQNLSYEGWVIGAAWNGDESQILTWSSDDTAVLWEAASGERLQTLSHDSGVIGAVWNGDESQILTWSSDETAVLWEAASGERLQTLSHEYGVVVGAAWNGDESQILTWNGESIGQNGTAILWEAASSCTPCPIRMNMGLTAQRGTEMRARF